MAQARLSRIWTFVVALLFCAAGAVGLVGTLVYLDRVRVDHERLELEVGHPKCPHEDCSAPHPKSNAPLREGAGGGLLCLVYLVYCGVVFVYAVEREWKPR